MKLELRVAKIEAELRASTTREQVYTLPGVRITVLENGNLFVLHSIEVVSVAFVDALLKERFPHTVASVALPCNHRDPVLCAQLGCLTEEPEENYD